MFAGRATTEIVAGNQYFTAGGSRCVQYEISFFRAIAGKSPVMKQFAALFGPEAAAPSDVLIRDWRLEERTSPQYWPPSQRYDLFGSPLLQTPTWQGRLLWTSTETSAIAPGHMEGALAAAERTVQTILDQPIHTSRNLPVSIQSKS